MMTPFLQSSGGRTLFDAPRQRDAFFSANNWLARLTLFSIVRPYLAELLLISLIINILSLVLPLVLLQIYDRVLRFSAVNTLQWLLVGVFVATLLESALRFGRSYVSGWIGARFEHLASCGAMAHLLTVPLARFEQEAAGVHLEQLNAIQTLKEFYSGQAALVVLELPFVVVFLVLIYHLGGTLVWVPIGLLVLFLLFAWYFQVRIYRMVKESNETDDKRIDFMIETLNGVHSVKALSLEAMMARRYERLLTESAIKAQEIGLHGADSQNIGLFFSQLASIAMVSFGGILVINQQLTVGGLVACSMLAGRSLQPMQMAVGIWARFQSIRIARERLTKLFDPGEEPPPSLAQTSPPPPTEAGATDWPARVVLQNVCFNTENHRIFEGITLEVTPGETVGIIGANGSGKTLLMKLIMGILSPTTGEVWVDGVSPALQRPTRMAYLPQEGVLFRGTILENLHTFREENSHGAMRAARHLGVEAFILSMPKGYETQVDEGENEMMPRGIKQRIVIARALATDPRLVLFDEANMAVDGNGDEYLRTVLRGLRGKATLILISHRPSLLRLADRVFELREGRLSPLNTATPHGGGSPSSARSPNG